MELHFYLVIWYLSHIWQPTKRNRRFTILSNRNQPKSQLNVRLLTRIKNRTVCSVLFIYICRWLITLMHETRCINALLNDPFRNLVMCCCSEVIFFSKFFVKTIKSIQIGTCKRNWQSFAPLVDIVYSRYLPNPHWTTFLNMRDWCFSGYRVLSVLGYTLDTV